MVQSTKIGDERTCYLKRRTSSLSSLDYISDGEDGQEEQPVAVNFEKADIGAGGIKGMKY